MAMTLLTTNSGTFSTAASFTSKINNTYKLYIFKFYDVNPANDDVNFTFQVNATDSTDYDRNITTSVYEAEHSEDNTTIAGLVAANDDDQANDDAEYQILAEGIGNGGDEGCVGELFLFDPSNTTYIKHFYATTNAYRHSNTSRETFIAGYINDATAIDDIQFKMSAGDMDAVIKMYGVG